MLATITWYEWFKAAHVLAAVVWIGGGTAVVLMALRTRRSKDAAQLVNVARQAEWLGTRVFTPLSIVVVAFGFAMMQNGRSPWDYGDFWVSFGIAIWFVSFLLGAGFLGPESGRLARLLSERPPEDVEVQRRVHRILVVARFDVVLLLLVVFDMTAKPFL